MESEISEELKEKAYDLFNCPKSPLSYLIHSNGSIVNSKTENKK